MNCLQVVGSIRVNTDDFYTPVFHKPLSLFGKDYSLMYRFLYLRNVISVPCIKRTDDRVNVGTFGHFRVQLLLGT